MEGEANFAVSNGYAGTESSTLRSHSSTHFELQKQSVDSIRFTESYLDIMISKAGVGGRVASVRVYWWWSGLGEGGDEENQWSWCRRYSRHVRTSVNLQRILGEEGTDGMADSMQRWQRSMVSWAIEDPKLIAGLRNPQKGGHSCEIRVHYAMCRIFWSPSFVRKSPCLEK